MLSNSLVKNFTILGISIFSLCASSVSFATQKPQWEVWSGGLASLSFVSSGTSGASSQTNISILSGLQSQWMNPGVGYFVMDKLQIRLSPSYYSSSNIAKTTGTGTYTASGYTILAGANYSFLGTSSADSYFAEAEIGFSNTTGATTNLTNFAWLVSAGKRFPIIPNFQYAPALTFYSMSQTAPLSAQTAFSIVPAQFTLTL